jgi:hypothetical protein
MLSLLFALFARRKCFVVLASTFISAHLNSGAARCAAAEILWGFEGVVNTTARLPSDVEVGSRFGGIIRFTSLPDANTTYNSGAQSHGWFGEDMGVELSLGGVDFSTIGQPDGRVSMHYHDGGFYVPARRPVDSLIISSTADAYWVSGPPISFGGSRRNIHFELHDFDLTILSDALPLEIPFDVRELEVATFSAGGIPADGPTRGFTGTIDRLYAIPEPGTGVLVGIGIGLVGLWYIARHATFRAPT